MKYAVACVLIFAVLALLRFFEGSPIRSWKAIVLTGIPLSFIVCYYLSCAFPAPPPPQPRSEKVAVNKAELERTFRRIAGVNYAKIEGPLIYLNFVEDKPLSEFKSIARQTGGTAAHLLQMYNTNRVVVFVTVNGQNRYALVYDTQTGIVDETTF
jgi:hypothetical protein